LLPSLDPVTRGMVQYSAMMPARRLLRADRVRARLRRGLADLFASYELIAWPTNPAPAPPRAAPTVMLPSGPALPDAGNLRQAVIANLAGVPGISVPVGTHPNGLPVGLQLLAAWDGEATLLDAAEHLKRLVP
jgi:Asp-tRNA(Asn)/Glu-tRNA(Gln) amidotransferase A subunit family amidase